MSDENQQEDSGVFLTPFIERNLSLTGAKLPNGRFESYMKVEFKKKNNNKITINAGSGVYDESSGSQKTATLHMPAFDFAIICKHARDIASKPNGFEFNGIKVNGVRKRRQGDDSKGIPKGWDGTVFIGKDIDGVCYMGILNQATGKLKFPFLPTSWTEHVNVRTNEPASQADVSADYSEAWADLLMPIVAALLVKHPYDYRVDQPPREKNGGWQGQKGGNGGGNNWQNKKQGGGGWGGNNNQGNSGGGNGGWGNDSAGAGSGGSSDSFDEDIPM